MKLSAKWIKQLQAQPESGMGYQLVVVTLKDGTTYPAQVMNCSELELNIKNRDIKNRDIEDIKLI